VLQGAEGLRSATFARGFALQQPVLLVTEQAAVVFSAGGLEAVLFLPLAATGAWCLGCWCWGAEVGVLLVAWQAVSCGMWVVAGWWCVPSGNAAVDLLQVLCSDLWAPGCNYVFFCSKSSGL